MASIGPKETSEPSERTPSAITYEELTATTAKAARVGIRAINASVGWEHYSSGIDWDLKSHPEAFLVAQKEGQPVGYVLSHRSGDKSHYVSFIAVLSTENRQGIGAELMLRTAKKVQQLGIRRLVLEFRGTKKGLLEFYEKVGKSGEAAGIIKATEIQDTRTSYPGGDPRYQATYTLEEPTAPK